MKLSSCLALALFTLSANADSATTSTEMLIKLTVQPMPCPKPALRYLLLPELREMNPGNPIPNYLRCTIELDPFVISQVPDRSVLKEADRAARLDRPDWQFLRKAQIDGNSMPRSDLRQMRTLASGLHARFREELAHYRFDDCFVTAKTMFAMSRHIAEHPTVNGGLVGITLALYAIGPLEEMLEQPGCPNLYWALTNLPSPLVPLDKALEGDRMWILGEIRALDDSAPMTPGHIQTLMAHLDRLLVPRINPIKSARAWIEARAKEEKLVTAARRRLAAAGHPEARLLPFPPEQVIMLDEKREYEVRRDEVMKLMNLPTYQAQALAARIQTPQEPALFDILLNVLFKLQLAKGRLEQRIALLRHIEALRMHAAAHDGKLPRTLADVTVPLPNDPYSGKAFDYKFDGETAHLRGSPPPGWEKVPEYNLHYQVTIQQ